MTDRSNITFIDITIAKVDNGASYGVGAELYRLLPDDKKEVYKAASLFINEPEIRSTSVAIQYVIPQLLNEVTDSELVIVYSNLPQFEYKRFTLKPRFNILAQNKGMNIKLVRRPRLLWINQNIMLLANDALSRRSSVIAQV
ncbi:hypothetical protein [Bacillus sp. Marseille-P3661]|uniref:hypothetical protein n=1 Tax=Bacillus sp. Marseille-P3661 TaxID=1936234 RepID=UPI000C8309FE|nr:hypothetical protein [Bacillus sp. Marseille-P3661]